MHTKVFATRYSWPSPHFLYSASYWQIKRPAKDCHGENLKKCMVVFLWVSTMQCEFSVASYRGLLRSTKHPFQSLRATSGKKPSPPWPSCWVHWEKGEEDFQPETTLSWKAVAPICMKRHRDRLPGLGLCTLHSTVWISLNFQVTLPHIVDFYTNRGKTSENEHWVRWPGMWSQHSEAGQGGS